MIADGPRASLASPNIFIAPSESRSFQMTDVTHAFGKFRGSSTFRPFNSLKLWRTLKSFKSCGWTLWRRSRTPSSTRQMLEPVWWRGFSFFLCCLGTSSPELSMEDAAVSWELYWGMKMSLLKLLLLLVIHWLVVKVLRVANLKAAVGGSLFWWFLSGHWWRRHGSLRWCGWRSDGPGLLWRWRGGSRGSRLRRWFPLLVQPLFELDGLLELLPAWTERPDLRRTGLFRRSFGRVFRLWGFYWLGVRRTGGICLRLWRGWTVGVHLGRLSGVRTHRLDLPPTFYHSQPLDSSVVTVEDKGGVGVLIPADVGETTGVYFSFFVKTGRRVPGFWSGFLRAFFPGQTAERWPISPQC